MLRVPAPSPTRSSCSVNRDSDDEHERYARREERRSRGTERLDFSRDAGVGTTVCRTREKQPEAIRCAEFVVFVLPSRRDRW